MKKTIYELHWEILRAAELVGHLPANQPTPQPLLQRIYTGNGMRLMGSPKPRSWSVTIETKAKADNGEVHTLKMQFKPSEPLMLSALINVIKHQWLDECDSVLADMTALEANATARCTI